MTSHHPDPISSDPVVDHLKAYLDALGRPGPDDSVQASIVAAPGSSCTTTAGVPLVLATATYSGSAAFPSMPMSWLAHCGLTVPEVVTFENFVSHGVSAA